MIPQPGFAKPERIHSPDHDLEVFKESVHKTMDAVYGTHFDDADEQQQVHAVRKTLDDHFDTHIDNSFSNPFEKEAEAEHIVLNNVFRLCFFFERV